MTAYTLEDFVRESNRIEGITTQPLGIALDAHRQFLAHKHVTHEALEHFVGVVSLGSLREHRNMNVIVGAHRPPKGGPEIVGALNGILVAVNVSKDRAGEAFAVHRRYETLHPFTDGNGRSGRALWLWMMGGIERVPLGFLHTWYYQSLQFGRPPEPETTT